MRRYDGEPRQPKVRQHFLRRMGGSVLARLRMALLGTETFLKIEGRGWCCSSLDREAGSPMGAKALNLESAMIGGLSLVTQMRKRHINPPYARPFSDDQA
jgi:hypothetical protein